MYWWSRYEVTVGGCKEGCAHCSCNSWKVEGHASKEENEPGQLQVSTIYFAIQYRFRLMTFVLLLL